MTTHIAETLPRIKIPFIVTRARIVAFLLGPPLRDDRICRKLDKCGTVGSSSDSNCALYRSYRRSFRPLEPCYRQSWPWYLTKNCADNPTGPITQAVFKLSQGKLRRTSLPCGNLARSLTEGHEACHTFVTGTAKPDTSATVSLQFGHSFLTPVRHTAFRTDHIRSFAFELARREQRK